jgi:hypothetical protein
MSVDPDVAATGQPYAFSGDDPLNGTDPLGLYTEGYCIGGSAGAGPLTASASACIVRKSDNRKHHRPKIAITITFPYWGGATYSAGKLSKFLKTSSLSASFNGNLNIFYQSSNAKTPQQLGGVFDNFGVAGGMGLGAAYVHETGAHGISVQNYGIGLDLGASVSAGQTYTVVLNVTGSAANHINNLILDLDAANPGLNNGCFGC